MEDSGYERTLSFPDKKPQKITKHRKIVFLGSPGVGKSAIISRYIEDTFNDYYNPTIQSVHKKIVPFNKDNIEIEILDFDGQTEYTIFSLSKFSFGVHGYILVYSIENRQSFELIQLLSSKLSTFVGKNIPKLLIANKVDINRKRDVSVEEGKGLSEFMDCPFLECSAKNNQNISKVFHSILTEITKYENNVDLKNYVCKSMFTFFVKYEERIKKFFYCTLSLNILISVCCIILGIYIGIMNKNFKNKGIIEGSILFLGIWNLVFTSIGIAGLYLKKKELLNYLYISMLISVVFSIGLLLISFFIDKMLGSMSIYFFLTFIFCIFIGGTNFFLSWMFKRIFKDELSTYMIV